MRIPWELLPIEPSSIPVLTAKMRGCRYRLGAKADSLDQQLAEIDHIDCSGFTRILVYKACGTVIPDGSWHQREYLRKSRFKQSTVDAGKLKDGMLRMFVLPQQPGPGVGRHVGFILNGMTYESYGGNGPGSRAWTGRGYQAKCEVFVIAYPGGKTN